jgi:hypothetical protein
VEAFVDGGDGPDPDDLHFEMESGPDTMWNRRVLEILLERLKETSGEALPERSDEYWVELLGKRYANMRMPWQEAQPRMMISGELENDTELQSRMVVTVKSRQCNNKKRTRRYTVSSKLSNDESKTYTAKAIPNSPTNSQLYHRAQG